MRAYLPLVSSPVARKRYTSPTRATVRPCWGIRIIGFIGLVYSLFCGQCLHELRRPLDPAAQLVAALDALRLDQPPALHRSAGDVELVDVRLLQRLIALVRAEPHDEGIPPDADEHVAVDQAADAADHLLLLDALLAGQGVPDAGGEGFIEGHRSLLSGWGSPRFKRCVFYRDGKNEPQAEGTEGC